MITPYLNLLPPSRRRHFDDLLLYSALRQAVILLGVTLVVSVAVLLAGQALLNRQLSKEKATTALVQARLTRESGSSLDQRIREFNALLVTVNRVQTDYVNWMPILNDLIAAIPTGITLSSLEFDVKGRSVVLKGTAARREDLLGLEDSLLATKRVVDPSSPISNLLQRERIPFELRFTLVLP